MVIQILLSVLLILYVVYAQIQRRITESISLLSTIAALAGLVLVWSPRLSNDLAHSVGIGRGVDLIFYVFIVSAAFISLYLHLRIEAANITVTHLARAMALRDPARPTSADTSAAAGPERNF